MLIIQSGFEYLNELEDGTFEIAKDGKRIEGPFFSRDSIINRFTEIQKLYEGEIEGWQFRFEPGGALHAHHKYETPKGGFYNISKTETVCIDPRIIDADIANSHINIKYFEAVAAPSNVDLYEKMMKYAPKIEKALKEFCHRFVQQAESIGFDPY